MLFSGQGYPELADRIADRLDIDLGGVELMRFSGGEMYARYLDSVRGADVFIVQSLCQPVNRNLMQLLIMIDAAKRASAKRITAVITGFVSPRQERKTNTRQPVTARLEAEKMRGARAGRGVAKDRPGGQSPGFFSF